MIKDWLAEYNPNSPLPLLKFFQEPQYPRLL
jgi:hypothetical protein